MLQPLVEMRIRKSIRFQFFSFIRESIISSKIIDYDK